MPRIKKVFVSGAAPRLKTCAQTTEVHTAMLAAKRTIRMRLIARNADRLRHLTRRDSWCRRTNPISRSVLMRSMSLAILTISSLRRINRVRRSRSRQIDVRKPLLYTHDAAKRQMTTIRPAPAVPVRNRPIPPAVFVPGGSYIFNAGMTSLGLSLSFGFGPTFQLPLNFVSWSAPL